MALAELSLPGLLVVFAGSAAAIGFAGTRLAHVADALADRTGMGEILAGAVFVGASTSLPGVITSVTTAWDGHPQLAIGNALGGLTAQTALATVDEEEQAQAMPADTCSDRALWISFSVYAGITAAAGYAIGQSSTGLVRTTGVSETAFGTLVTAVPNSLPELVTAIAAVRIGAANLAVGDIIGGNAFEVLLLAAADFAYLEGAIYDEFTPQNVFTAVTVIMMTGVLVLGMLHREGYGFGNIGWESASILGLYVMSAVVLFA